MEISYWKSRWQKNNIGWHQEHPYPPLPQFWPSLALAEGATVLVPLCGKSKDLNWLAEQGYHVIGVEASGTALEQFTDASRQSFSRTSSHGYPLFQSSFIELWEGNFLTFPDGAVDTIDAIYDKAALVALPPDKREQYVDRVLQLCHTGTQLLLQTFEYNQSEMAGPPFSVPYKEIQRHFEQHFQIQLLQEQSRFEDVQKFQHRGLSSYFAEKIYHLYPG
jgi:thiopurine S-methyltransferase